MWLLEKINKPLARMTREKLSEVIKIRNKGNSLVVWWLGLGTFTARAHVRSLVQELRSHKPSSATKRERT